MKILFSVQDMSGGAPRSTLAHILLAQESGHEVVATIGRNIDASLIGKKGVHIISIDNFNIKRPLKNIINIFHWLKLLSIEKPDMIYSNRANQYKFLSVVSDLAKVPILPVQAGGVFKIMHIKPVSDKAVIVYSSENKDEFLKAGFEPSKIHVISNRIDFSGNTGNIRPYCDERNIIITFTGNITDRTINGIEYTINMFLKNKDKIKEKFFIQFLGEDPTKDKIYESKIVHKVENANEILKGAGQIKLLGWVDDVESLQSESHVCIGKGRSIIQPAMMGKVCFVISENGFLTRARQETINDLTYYNFSGRGKQQDDTEDLFKILYNRENLRKMEFEARTLKELVIQNYASANGKGKLNKVYETVISEYRARNAFWGLCRAFMRFAAIYFWAGMWVIRESWVRR